MNEKTVLLMDIGGTHCRAKIVQGPEGLFDSTSVKVSRMEKITDKQSFFKFITEMIVTGSGAVRPDYAVLCFAGPVIRESVSMFNWTGDREIGLAELIHAGLPESGISLLNDMEAAAFGLIACRKGKSVLDEVVLYQGSGMKEPRNDNSVLMIPGTGIGVSAIVDMEQPGSGREWQALGCELQHTPIPVLNQEHYVVMNRMKTRLSIDNPTWEDFVSGRGLENIYSCLVAEGIQVTPLPAAEIAGRAVAGSDGLCKTALDMFYQCCGALAQVLALVFQPYGGIRLAGESTRKNYASIPGGPFLGQLHDNEVRADLLMQFPVYLVRSELNLDGAAYAADRYLRYQNSV